jgi:UDP-GlcNAc:undecaprenyl-phosphate/decaprenyl-phosphate GlcNAc-1-phosphate transferase
MIKSFKLNLFTAILGCGIFAFQAGAAEPVALKTQKDQVNYAIGVNFVSNSKQQGIEFDLDLVIQGMKDAQSGGKLLMTDEEVRKAIYIYQTEVRKKHEQARTKAARSGKKQVEKAPAGK